MAINQQVGDLSEMAKEIEKVMQKHLKLKERPAICLAFTCEKTGWNEVHYVLNISRPEAVGILRQTAEKLTWKSN
jgi:hypothetical protein